jgi:tRNA(adenine34) deaminase
MELQRQNELMRLAMQEAATAAEEGNYPFGAVMTDADGLVLAAAHNTQETDRDPTAHAEINLIRRLAKEYDEEQFHKFIMVSNAESCSMCFSAAIKAGIRKFIFGAPSEPHMDPYLTVAEVVRHSLSQLEITYGVLMDECVQQIKEIRVQQRRLGQ